MVCLFLSEQNWFDQFCCVLTLNWVCLFAFCIVFCFSLRSETTKVCSASKSSGKCHRRSRSPAEGMSVLRILHKKQAYIFSELLMLWTVAWLNCFSIEKASGCCSVSWMNCFLRKLLPYWSVTLLMLFFWIRSPPEALFFHHDTKKKHFHFVQQRNTLICDMWLLLSKSFSKCNVGVSIPLPKPHEDVGVERISFTGQQIGRVR